MKIISKSDANSFSNSDTCHGLEYGFDDPDINVAVITVNGRYPAKGLLVNEVCKEIGYVISGSGKIGTSDRVYELKPGDSVFIKPGEKFYWEGEKLIMVVPCSPAFYPEQHKPA